MTYELLALRQARLLPSPRMAFTKNWNMYASGYAYAANEPDIGERMPGEALTTRTRWQSDHRPPADLPDVIKSGLLHDGWQQATVQDLEDKEAHIIAAAAHPYFYQYVLSRRDADGTFSYKDEGGAPTNLTKHGAPIRDPKAITGSSEIFLGYFVLPKSGVPILVP